MADRLLSVLVRAVRIHRKLTQGEVAARIGVRVPTISEWERGRRPMGEETLERLAGGLGLSVRELLVEGLRLTGGAPEKK